VCATNQNTEIIIDANNSHRKTTKGNKRNNGQMSGNKMNSEFSFFSFPHPQTVTVRKKNQRPKKGGGKMCVYVSVYLKKMKKQKYLTKQTRPDEPSYLRKQETRHERAEIR
jgi:hypothetical protein